jgi:myo-inositol-1(or 4)-monophosphatase
VAAGTLLIREAGGFVSEPGGGDRMMESGSIVAGNETIHRQLCALLKG